MWDQVADLFADNGTIEMAQQGVYVGKKRVREFLGLQGPHGLVDGWLNDHMQLQPIVDVAPDGSTARVRSRELGMTGKVGGQGYWSEGIYENTFVKDNGVWKIASLHFYPTFITDYDKGWGKDAQPVPTASTQLPPDRPPTETYAIYPKPHVPPFHYRNPVTGKAPTYPTEADGGPSKQLAAAALVPVNVRYTLPKVADVNAAVAEAERVVERVKDFHEIDNLESAYGYYLDKNLWNDLANLFARDGSIELAQRGVYKGRERVRGFLVQRVWPWPGRAGRGPARQSRAVAARHPRCRRRQVREDPPAHDAADVFGPRASMGGSVYENEAVKEDGVWKFSVVHTYNTFTASYDGGWTKVTASNVPGPSKDFPPDTPPTLVFEMFPSVYDIPFHYANPVTGRTELPPIKENTRMRVAAAAPAVPGKMPPDIAAALREIGPKIEGRSTAELYAPLQQKEPYQNVTLTRDLSYGPHERHVLDLFVSPDTNAKSGKPVVVFIHGGGFSGGSKHAPKLAVLRQRRAVGGVAWSRGRNDQLSARAAVSVSGGH